MGGPRGYDGGKKVNGRKRHLVVDTQGLLLKAKVLPADLHDRPAAELVLTGLHQLYPGIRLLWADTAYRGLGEWLAGTLGWSLEITRHWRTGARVWVAAGQPPPERPAGFQVAFTEHPALGREDHAQGDQEEDDAAGQAEGRLGQAEP